VIAGANAEIATLKVAWKQVKAGVPAERVKELLGAPTQELTINGKLAWYYIYPGIGAGSVFFSDSHRVSSTQTPPLGW
jgi:outer membrane protein assembly factor BamE (lipoprotein component of BamABCDE complex)